MDYQLIAMDLDETLLNDDHKVCEENIKWINKARSEHNVRFVAATGRGYNQIIPELTQIGLANMPGEYTISYNGAAITENKDFKLIAWNGMSFEKMKDIFDFGWQQDVCLHVYADEELFVYRVNDDEYKRLTAQKLSCTYLNQKDLSPLMGKRIAKILYENTDMDYLMSLEDKMTAITQGSVSVSYSSNRYMEFNTLGVDKGAGLTLLANKLSIPIEQTIAIGDNYNDMAMLKAAGVSVAAQNGVADVKKACDYITKANNNEGVVAEAIRKYIYHEDI